MADIILAPGTTALPSAWQTVASDGEHIIALTGGDGAWLHVEMKVGEGEDDAQKIGRLFVSSSRPDAASARVAGPVTYRVRREAGDTSVGCVREPGSSGESGT